MDNFEHCLSITLKWEGGYSNHPDDPGGPTMKGVIQKEYDAWRKKHGLRTQPVKRISETELRAIYRAEYWDAMKCGDLPDGVDLCVFDAAVNSGVGRAKKWAAQTDAANIQVPEEHIIDAYCDTRLAFLQRLGHLWRVFGAGWRRRVQGIRAQAHVMNAHPHAATPWKAHGEPEENHK